MKRIHVPPDRIEDGLARAGDEARHHLLSVLRLAPGAEVEVFDGRGRVYEGRVREDGDIALGASRELPPLPPVTLAQALVRGEKLDLVVQKATELGVSRVVPVAMERSVVKLDARRGEERAVRWRKIAAEAARQCGRADVPDVEPPRSLSGFLAQARARGEDVAALWEGPGERLGSWLADHPGALALVVGPEGGIAPAELSLLRGAGAAPVSLGPRILRTETAGLAALAVVLHARGELG